MERPGSADLHVNIIERVMVAPCLPLPKTILQLSRIDKLGGGFANVLLVFGASDSVSADPAKTIREAFSKILVYYFPFAGRLRKKENGDIEVECTGQGALFVEAMADSDLSVIGELDEYNPSFGQLQFSPPLDTDYEDLNLLTVQVTRFTCGGFVMGASVYQCLCDGNGLGQFFKGMAEMARGEVKPSIEPIWSRELLKPEDFVHLRLYLGESISPPLAVEKVVQASHFISLEKINHIKRCIMEESKEFFSSFEIAAALVWAARTKAFQIPHNEDVNLLLAMDARRSFKPPIPKGYYGNVIGLAHARDHVHNLLTGSLLHALTIIKKSMFSFNESLTSRVLVNPSTLDVSLKYENLLTLSDWRRLGYNEVDFGWGNAINVSTLQQQWENAVVLPTYITFLQPPKYMPDGIKILMFMPQSRVKTFKIEMEAMINKYVTKVSHSKL